MIDRLQSLSNARPIVMFFDIRPAIGPNPRRLSRVTQQTDDSLGLANLILRHQKILAVDRL